MRNVNSNMESVRDRLSGEAKRCFDPDTDSRDAEKFSEAPPNKTSFSALLRKLSKDRNSIFLLMMLYVLQGIPLGLSASVPMLLQAKKVGYKQQAMFSFVSWPFSIKLIWAPIVDTVYSRSFGRRKSWVVPLQYCIGTFMISLSYMVNDLLGDQQTPPSILVLTFMFFMLHFFTATQDIAVDGWALTMLSRENVGYASTCNTVGQTAGYFLGFTIFMALESKEFCNAYLRWEPQETGLLDLQTFLFFWGLVFIVVTTGILFFKSENRERHAEEKDGVLMGYRLLLQVLKLPAVQCYALGILTSKIAFAAMDSVTGLKLIEAGLPKENIALMAVPLLPLQVLLPLLISHFTAGPRPLDVFFKAYIPRMLFGVVFAAILYWTVRLGTSGTGELPLYYYAVILVVFCVHQVFVCSMFVAAMAFHARVSDPAIGGTYITLLNTVMNLAGTWSGTLALWMVDSLSFKDCEGVTDYELDCDTLQELQACEAAGGHCVTHLDGYYVESAICILIGCVWLLWQRRKMQQLQSHDESAWRCRLN